MSIICVVCAQSSVSWNLRRVYNSSRCQITFHFTRSCLHICLSLSSLATLLPPSTSADHRSAHFQMTHITSSEGLVHVMCWAKWAHFERRRLIVSRMCCGHWRRGGSLVRPGVSLLELQTTLAFHVVRSLVTCNNKGSAENSSFH